MSVHSTLVKLAQLKGCVHILLVKLAQGFHSAQVTLTQLRQGCAHSAQVKLTQLKRLCSFYTATCTVQRLCSSCIGETCTAQRLSFCRGETCRTAPRLCLRTGETCHTAPRLCSLCRTGETYTAQRPVFTHPAPANFFALPVTNPLVTATFIHRANGKTVHLGQRQAGWEGKRAGKVNAGDGCWWTESSLPPPPTPCPSSLPPPPTVAPSGR